MFFCQLHRRIARSRGRYAIHTEDLVEAQTQQLANGGLRLSDVGDVAPDHIVERCARLRDTVDKFRQKTAVTLRQLQLAQCFRKRDIGVCILNVYPLEHPHRQFTHMVDLFLTVVLHYAPFLVSFDGGSMISSNWRRTSFMSTLVL